MDCRERTLRAIRFETPDRIPVSYSLIPGALFTHGRALLDVCRRYPNDFYDETTIRLPPRDTANYRPDGTYFKRYTDEWGCVWECLREGISGEVKQSPLDDWGNLRSYRLPPVPNATPEGRRKLREDMARMKERYIGWGGGGSLYERMQYLRGVENLMLDIAEDREEVYLLADRIVNEYLLPTVELAVEAGADLCGFGDDWGTQQALLISPAAWRRVFKPRYRRLFDLAHQGGALTWMHSDGMTLEIVEDFIEIGLNAMNPQINTMDWATLRRIAKGRLCLVPDFDRQGIFPFGTPSQVREHARAIRDTFGAPEGGLVFFGPIEAGLPLANIEAICQALEKYRGYYHN